MHIPHVCFHLSKVFIGFGLLDKRSFVRLHLFQALIREKCITPLARGFRHMVLREPVDQINVCSQKVRDARHSLEDEFAVMHHELQVECGKCPAGFAWTGCLAI